MQLVEQRKIALDEPVSKIVSGLPAAWSKVSVRHCLSHTTGLPYADEDEINGTVIEGDRDRLIAKLASMPVVEPGTRIDYNSTDQVLLGMVIEKVSGLAFLTTPVAGPGSVSCGGGAAVWRVKVPSQHLIVILLTNLQGSLPESFIGDIVAPIRSAGALS